MTSHDFGICDGKTANAIKRSREGCWLQTRERNRRNEFEPHAFPE